MYQEYQMKRVAVYLGSSSGNKPAFCEMAYNLGRRLGEAHITVVYGGASVGTMKSLADGALGAGGRVMGVFPQGFLGKAERHFSDPSQVMLSECTEIVKVRNMAQRKKYMSDLCNCCVIMPGGWGTVDELMGHLVNRDIGRDEKPIFVFNYEGYWDTLKAMADKMFECGFISSGAHGYMVFCDSMDELVGDIQEYLKGK